MIFEKQNIQLTYSNSKFWNRNLNSTDRVVKGRNYRIRRNHKGITIDRRINDIFDTMGFVPFKMLAIANGEIKEKENQIKVDLIVELKPIYEVFFIASGIIFGLIIIFICFEDLKIGLLFGLFFMIIILIQYLLFRHGINEFKSDLENDIEYFEK